MRRSEDDRPILHVASRRPHRANGEASVLISRYEKNFLKELFFIRLYIISVGRCTSKFSLGLTLEPIRPRPTKHGRWA